MKKDNKYVVFEISEYVENIEPFEQYYSFGEDLHVILVNKKPIVVTKEEDGTYTYKGHPIFVHTATYEIDHSFTTRSNVMSSIAGARNIPYGIKKLAGVGDDYVEFGEPGRGGFYYGGTYAFATPLEEYRESMTAFKYLNAHLSPKRRIALSTSRSKASDQLYSIGIDIDERSKRKHSSDNPTDGRDGM